MCGIAGFCNHPKNWKENIEKMNARMYHRGPDAGDIWANPVGSWQTTMAAKEVYRFLDAEENLFWYFRPGTHYHDLNDIQMLVNIICQKTKPPK